MWALLELALIGVVAAVPTDPAVTYHIQLQTTGNNLLSHDLTSQVEDQLKKKCQRYGDSDSFDHVINERNSVVRELQGAAMREVAGYIESGERPDYLKVFCKLSPTIKRSAARMSTALKQCTKPQDRDELGYLNNVTESFVDYVCYNDGQRVKSFVIEGGLECILQKQTGLKQCAETAISGEESDNETDNDIFSSDEFLNKEEKEKKLASECREFADLETCLKRELDQCPNPSSSNFVVGIMDAIVSPTCKKYVN